MAFSHDEIMKEFRESTEKWIPKQKKKGVWVNSIKRKTMVIDTDTKK